MFRFTIRDVLWLTVVVATGPGWWADHNMLRSLNAMLGKNWMEHVRKEHPGQAEYERLMSELTGGHTD